LPDQGHNGVAARDILLGASLAASPCKPAIEHKVTHALRVAHGVRNRHGAALRHAEQGKAIKTGRVDYAFQVAYEGLQ